MPFFLQNTNIIIRVSKTKEAEEMNLISGTCVIIYRNVILRTEFRL